MKLYTEEQVVRAIAIAVTYEPETYMDVLERIKPIKLPTDEEISKIALEKPLNISSSWFNFVEGAMWLKEQIKQQG